MKKLFIAFALLWSLSSSTFLQSQTAKTTHSAGTPPVEARVRQLWEAFKNKDKTTLSTLLDDGFRMFEEGTTAFGDKKSEVDAVDEFELRSYTLSDFTVKPTGPNTAVVTYIAQYEGKSGGEITKAKSVFGEVWVHTGNNWKALYLQETYVK